MRGRLAGSTVAAVLFALGPAVAATPVIAAPAPHAAHLSAASPSGSWTRYHFDDAHTGTDTSQPQAAGATTGWVSPTLDESVYGEPLVYNGIVYVGTLNNTVYALNQGTGAVVWSKNVGAPQTSGWVCGNINPTGILGTGVIDVAQSRVYYVAFLTQYTSYYLYGFDLATGTIVQTTQLLPTGFDWTIQQQRGALALSSDGTHVYIPFGGRAGDCGPYHAWVIGVPTAGGLADELFEGPSTGAGSWAAGGVAVDDTTGHVFFSTGNAIPCSGATYSDSVIETNASLGVLSFFQPLDWESHWCGPDLDLGSIGPALISPSLMFMTGKYGQGFLLNPASLGGTGGQLFPAQAPYVGADVCVGNHSDASFGSFAYASPRLYIECDGHGLVSLTVDNAAPSFSLCDSSCNATGTWQAGGTATFGPPIVSGGVAWVADINGGGLYGFNAVTGAQVFHSAAFGVTHFTTPSEAGGQIFVASDTTVRSFNMVGGCTTMSASAAPPTTATIGTQVVVTGSASGVGGACPNPQYQFWLLPPGGTWYVAKSYSSSNSFTWFTNGNAAGSYLFSVWARDASSGASYDSFATVSYSLTATACTGLTASAAPPTSAEVGSAVTISGTASGCPNPLYEFWMQPPNGNWTMLQAYSSTNNIPFNNKFHPPGVYRFAVWTRDTSSPGTSGTQPYTWDALSSFTYSLTTCSTLTATPSPASPTSIGTPVTVTGSAGGCTSPLYEFWLLPPGGGWTMVQPYSATPTYNWSTGGLSPGSYLFAVWTRDQVSPGVSGTNPNTYDVVSSFSFTLNRVPCTGMSASPSPATSANRGTMVTVTGAATGCPNPQYEFWLKLPDGTWTLARGWSSSNTFSWNTTAAMPLGSYLFSVWTRDLSSNNSYDQYSAFGYTLTTAPCTGVTGSAMPANTTSRGMSVTVTGTASGCPNPQYEFWIKNPDGSWTLAQGWGGNTFTWVTTSATPAGSYLLVVWARDASSAGTSGTPPYTYDAVSAFNYTLT